MTTTYSGGCACGAIRYECTAEPIAMFFCHCRDCQRATGGPYSAVVYFPATAFKFVRGSPRHHLTPSESGGYNKRGFCDECGSRISGGENADGIGINAGSLDDPSLFRPQENIFASDAQPWDTMDSVLPTFEQYSTR